MIRFSIRYAALALPLAGLLAGPAAAQNAMPALRANVVVTGDIVRIGDLVENAGAVADVPIFNVGAAFWGLVFGFAASWLLERGDFRK